MWILVVSPIGPVRRSLQVLLETEQHKVLVADGFERALQMMAQNAQLDVIITEWKLAEGTASELKRRAQQIDRQTDERGDRPATEFVILTTPDLQAARTDRMAAIEQIKALGFEDILEKPVDRQQLIDRLDAILGKSRNRVPGTTGPETRNRLPPESPPVNAPQREEKRMALSRTLRRLQAEVLNMREATELQLDRLLRISVEVQGVVEVLEQSAATQAAPATVG